MIVAEKLTKRYGPHIAVDSIDFRVPKGEVVGFLGPNGAGKTTTLRMVAGFMPPTSGAVTVNGHDVVDESLEARASVGYMPEAVPLYPEMRVSEYLSFRAEVKGVRANRRAAVDRAMELANVTDVARRIVGELSKGYRQRVGLADALVSNPPLLILDEPTAGLDPNQIVDVRELITSIGKEHTVFLSTHILPEVEAVCTRVVIIARGRIAAAGTTDEIRARMAGEERDAVVILRGDETSARAVIEGQPGVLVRGEPVRLEGSGDTSVTKWALGMRAREADRATTDDDLTERLVAACVGAGLGVRQVQVNAKSLEAIFQELTTDEDPNTEATRSDDDDNDDDARKSETHDEAAG